MNSIEFIWKAVLEYMGKELSETTLTTWFDEVTPISCKDNILSLSCPNQFKREMICSMYMPNLQAALQEIFSVTFSVVFLTEEELSYHLSEPQKRPTSLMDSGLFTFETFVVGKTNELGYAAAKAVAEAPAMRYNPLFIYGNSGLGKTHLLYAIAHELRLKQPGIKILYIKGDDFTNELISSIQTGTTAQFREKYRQTDVLLMDDIQFIAGKQQTQEEFFHTFNTLYESHCQIVLTSDRPPKEMVQLENRLQSRFEWGLLVDIQPPDFETRLAIVRNKAMQLGAQVPDEIMEYLATRVTANVRQLEGSLNKLLAYRDLVGQNLDAAATDRAVKDMLKQDMECLPTVDTIIEEVCSFYNIEESMVRGPSKRKEAVNARQVAMLLCRRLTKMSTPEIGAAFGGRDHTTVLYAVEKMERATKNDPSLEANLKAITTNINARP